MPVIFLRTRPSKAQAWKVTRDGDLPLWLRKKAYWAPNASRTLIVKTPRGVQRALTGSWVVWFREGPLANSKETRIEVYDTQRLQEEFEVVG